MITGEVRNQIDRIWDAFWSGGISNPLEVIEQITYLLFLRRLDDLHALEEFKAARTKKPIERRIFSRGRTTSARTAAAPTRTSAGRASSHLSIRRARGSRSTVPRDDGAGEGSAVPRPALRVRRADDHPCLTVHLYCRSEVMLMRYRVAIHRSEEGVSVSVPGLPGGWSQGATEDEAIQNIRDAIREYLSVVEEQLRGEEVREVEVTV